MTEEKATPIEPNTRIDPCSLLRRMLGTVYLLFLLSILALSQFLLAYRNESEKFLQKFFKGYRGWVEILPDYVLPPLSLSTAVILAFTGTILLILWRWTSWDSEINREVPLEIEPPANPLISKRMAWSFCLVLLGLSSSALLWAMVLTTSRGRLAKEGFLEWLFLRTTGDGAVPGAGWIWLISILLAMGAFIFLDLSNGRFPRLGGVVWEWVFVAVLTLSCMIIYSIGITDWRYSVVGDEYAFYYHAEMLDGMDALPFFGEHGVYGTHPQLSSIFQMVVMRLAGFTAFGWRFSSVLAAAVVLPPLYLFTRLLIGKRAAVTSAILFLVSHYNFSFAHIPYNNNHVMFPVMTAMALFLLARSQNSLLFFYMCGLATGLGFHTFFSGRVGLPIILALWMCWCIRPQTRWVTQAVKPLFAILVGFILVALPVIRNPVSSWELMTQQTTFAQEVIGETAEPTTILGHQVQPEFLKRLEQNVVHSLLAPLTYDAHKASPRHYVSGGLTDRATSAMAFLGLLQSLLWFYRRRWFSLWIGYGLVLVLVGMTSPAEYPLITRMLLMVPFIIILASAGVEKVLAIAGSLLGVWMTQVLLVMFLATSAFLNGHEVFFRFMEQPANSGHNLVISLLQESSPKTHVVYVLEDQYLSDNVIDTMAKTHGYSCRFGISRFGPTTHNVVPLPIPCLVAVYLNNPSWPAIQESLSRQFHGSASWILPHSLDGGIGVIEIGETGWTPSSPRQVYVPPEKKQSEP